MNAELNRAIDERVRTKPVLGDDEIAQWHRDHVADPDHEAMHNINAEMQRVMSGVEVNASSVGASAGTFGEQFDRLAIALAEGESSELPAMLTGAVAGAHDMKGSTVTLVQQIRDGRLEIERLRAALTRARDEVLMDPLTGVLNRKGFDLSLASLMQRPQVSGHSHSLIMFGDVVAERHRYLSMPLVFIGHACLITRCRTGSTGITSLGCAASSWRSGIGGDSTHWCTGTWGMTWPTSLAAAFVIRRTPHDGRIPRRLQLKAAR